MLPKTMCLFTLQHIFNFLGISPNRVREIRELQFLDSVATLPAATAPRLLAPRNVSFIAVNCNWPLLMSFLGHPHPTLAPCPGYQCLFVLRSMGRANALAASSGLARPPPPKARDVSGKGCKWGTVRLGQDIREAKIGWFARRQAMTLSNLGIRFR